eukprot:gene6195-10202_t
MLGYFELHCQKLIKKETKDKDILNMIESIEERMIEEWKNIDILFYATAFVNPILKTLSFLNDEMKETIVKFIESELNNIEIQDEDLKKEEREKEFQFFENLYGIKFQRNSSQNNELINYINELPQDPSEDILAYWKNNAKKYPKLSALARNLLSIQGSSADVERDWNFVGNMITEKRNQLKPEKVSKMAFVKKNIRFSKYYTK